MNAIHATLNNRPLLSLRVELRRGAEPSIFSATLARDERLPEVGGQVELRLSEGENARTLLQFHITHLFDLGDGRVEVRGADVRERWAGLPISARFNLSVGDGSAFEPASLSAGAPWNLTQVVAALFAAANEPEVAISGLNSDAIPRDLNLRGAALSSALQAALAGAGQTLSISDDGGVVASSPAETAFTPDPARVMAMSAENVATPAAVEVVGGSALELLTLDEGWAPVIPGDGSADLPADEFFPLALTLAAWGIAENDARKACLSDAGFERLVGATAPHSAARVNALKRHAFRSFRAPQSALTRLPWLPIGGMSEGALLPAQLRVARDEPLCAAPAHANESAFEQGALANEREPFELDLERGLIHLARPPYALSATSADDTTFQGRALVGDPVLELTVSATSARPVARFTFGEGEPVAIAAPQLTAIYDGDAMLNRAALKQAARELAQSVCSTPQRRYKLAGLIDAQAGGDVACVLIEADEHGLTTTVEQAPTAVVPAPLRAKQAASTTNAVAPLPAGLHQPINAWRSGPLILRTGEGAPETESYLAVEAAHRDNRTHALELALLGPLAHGFHMASNQPQRAGRWFFIAGVEAIEKGRVRVLGADDAHDPRHDPLSLDALSTTRRIYPRGYRGVLVSLGDGPRFIDAGPLVSDGRGSTGGDASNLVADLEGDKLSAKRAGPLHFLTVLSYSPAHQAWVPSLNLRDEETGGPRSGRGLFAERDGHSLGRLTATNQGGPILGDARACEKHRFAQCTADDGAYIESSGHLSTESFFKVPGDEVHDAPVKFVPTEFEGGVPPWPPFEAEIKYDANAQHRWNKQARPGLWRVQYRVPFTHAIPPTWKPPIKPPVPPIDAPPTPPWPTFVNACLPDPSIQPIVGENEIWAPSHDWIPAPSTGSGEETPFPGVSLKSAGFAAENAGITDASAGGAIVLPPRRGIAQAQEESGTRDTFFALHPEVVLAFGFPRHTGSGAGRIASGWNMKLSSDAHLVAEAVDTDAQVQPDKARGLHITGHAQIGKSGAMFAGAEDSGAIRLAEGAGEGIAFGAETKLYCPAPSVLRTDGEISAASASFDGKLTVGGLIDPTGLQLTPQSANPGSAATLWADSAAGSRLMWGSNSVPYVSEVQPLDADLTALAALGGTGLAVRTAANTWAQRSLAVTGGSGISLNNGDGVAGNPTLNTTGALNALAGVSLAQGDVLYATGASTLVALAKSASASRYLSNTGSSNNPAWAQIDLGNGVSGALPVANGGTGATSLDGALAALGGATSRSPNASARHLGYDGTSGGYFTNANLFGNVQHLAQDTSATHNYKLLALDASNVAKYVNLDDLDPTGQKLICRTVSYTGNGTSGRTLTLAGINRAYFIFLQRNETTGSVVPIHSMPVGATGAIVRRWPTSGVDTKFSLDAPSAGTSQVLTINANGVSENANGGAYTMLVIGTPT
jgi:hypothetical protein